MTLPYPFEVETGRLQARLRAPRAPFDIARHFEDAVRIVGEQLEVFGTVLGTAEPHTAIEKARHFRDALTARFNQWRPNADAATWHLFESQARPALRGRVRADDETLRLLLLTVSGL
jgi:hypothetical protein